MIRWGMVLALMTWPALAQTLHEMGAHGDGSGSDTAAFQRAQNMEQARGGGTVRVSPGLYSLGSNAYTAGPVAWLFERGARLAGAGQLDAVADEAVLNASGLSLARLYASTGNEHGLFVSARAVPTTGTEPYEKTGFIASLIQGDPSTYASATLRDLVGFESQGVIAPGNLTGRIWGFNAGVGPLAGADGYAVGGEFGVQSYSGSEAGPLGTPTSKIGVHAVAYGTSSSTAAFVVSGNGTTWQDGYVAQVGAISAGGHAVSVRPAGTARAADVAWLGADGSLGLTRQAEIHAGAFGVARSRVLVAETQGAGRVELTDDGGAPTAANTIAPGTKSALVIKRIRVLVFSPGTGWTGVYTGGDVLVSRGAGMSLAMVPALPTVGLAQQIGTAPGVTEVGVTTVQGRVALTLTATGAAPLHGVAEVETMEVR